MILINHNKLERIKKEERQREDSFNLRLLLTPNTKLHHKHNYDRLKKLRQKCYAPSLPLSPVNHKVVKSYINTNKKTGSDLLITKKPKNRQFRESKQEILANNNVYKISSFRNIETARVSQESHRMGSANKKWNELLKIKKVNLPKSKKDTIEQEMKNQQQKHMLLINNNKKYKFSKQQKLAVNRLYLKFFGSCNCNKNDEQRRKQSISFRRYCSHETERIQTNIFSCRYKQPDIQKFSPWEIQNDEKQLKL